ncbi:MAG: pilin [Patescibacteria group bacterium]
MKNKFLFFSFIFLFIPLSLSAAGSGDFVPLVSLPTLDTGSTVTIAQYVNSVFVLVIILAAMLAVLRIVTGGFKYMIEESISAKGEARLVIQGAVIGLLLLLGSWIILTTINPQIVDLSALRFNLTPSPETLADLERAREDAEIRNGRQLFNDEASAEEAAKKCVSSGGQVLAGPDLVCTYGPFNNQYSVREDEHSVCWKPKYSISCKK